MSLRSLVAASLGLGVCGVLATAVIPLLPYVPVALPPDTVDGFVLVAGVSPTRATMGTGLAILVGVPKFESGVRRIGVPAPKTGTPRFAVVFSTTLGTPWYSPM